MNLEELVAAMEDVIFVFTPDWEDHLVHRGWRTNSYTMTIVPYCYGRYIAALDWQARPDDAITCMRCLGIANPHDQRTIMPVHPLQASGRRYFGDGT